MSSFSPCVRGSGLHSCKNEEVTTPAKWCPARRNTCIRKECEWFVEHRESCAARSLAESLEAFIDLCSDPRTCFTE